MFVKTEFKCMWVYFTVQISIFFKRQNRFKIEKISLKTSMGREKSFILYMLYTLNLIMKDLKTLVKTLFSLVKKGGQKFIFKV